MMQSKLVVAGAPLGALAALAFVAGPAQERVFPQRGPSLGHHASVDQAHSADGQHRRQGEEQFDQLSEGTAWRFPLHDLGARVPPKKIAAFGGR